jgi:hypothetical protein
MLLPEFSVVGDSANSKGIRLTTLLGKVPLPIATRLACWGRAAITFNPSASNALQQTLDAATQVEYPTLAFPGSDPAKATALAHELRSLSLTYVKALDSLKVPPEVPMSLLSPYLPVSILLTSSHLESFVRNPLSTGFSRESMESLSGAICSALCQSTPVELEDGGWHLPFLSSEEKESLPPEKALALSVSRCYSLGSDSTLGVQATAESVTRPFPEAIDHIAVAGRNTIAECNPYGEGWGIFRPLLESTLGKYL